MDSKCKEIAESLITSDGNYDAGDRLVIRCPPMAGHRCIDLLIVVDQPEEDRQTKRDAVETLALALESALGRTHLGLVSAADGDPAKTIDHLNQGMVSLEAELSEAQERIGELESDLESASDRLSLVTRAN